MNALLAERKTPSGVVLQLARGDITEEATDAIVNAANERLAHGAGVAAAIARKAGPVLAEESERWVGEHGPVRHAEPAWTSAGDLPCRYVIHAVGPVWGTGDEENRLAAAVEGSLRVARRLGVRSIALPAISTGVYGFPLDRAARAILGALLRGLAEPGGLELVRVVLWSEEAAGAFRKAWEELPNEQT
ncbi:MAG: macro domain-containing protein [Fimbriimonadaceae bacterium]